METRTLHLPPEENSKFLERIFPRKKFHIRYFWMFFGAIAFASITFCVISAFLILYYQNRIVTRATLSGISLQNKTYAEALQIMNTRIEQENSPYTVTFNTEINNESIVFATDSAWLGFSAHTKETADKLYEFGHTGKWWTQLLQRWDALTSTEQEVKIPLTYSTQRVNLWMETISENVLIKGSAPQAIWNPNQIQYDVGSFGQELDHDSFWKMLDKSIGKASEHELPLIVTHIPLTTDAQILSENRLKALHGEKIILQVSDEEQKLTISGEQFFAWISLPTGFDVNKMMSDLESQTKIWNREPINAVFQQNQGGELTEFQPDRTGRKVLVSELVQRVQSELSNPEREAGESTILVPIHEQPAEITLADTNSLGIHERIGVGTSTFYGSIPNRVHNVAITGEKLNATFVPAGEEFSFNKSIGPVNRSTGYKAAYVIQNGRTVLGDGGGVCQASTTMFRAILDAGLPITQWKAHSYRVGYYEQNEKPGFDATVYSPSVDLKFKNDTAHAIVITSTVDVDNRYFLVEIWGTNDGRESVLADYTTWNQRSAPAPLYQEDPTLPRGVTKQVDWAAPGLNTRFTYTVKNADGSERFQRDFTSVFRPWQAVFLVGTGN